MALTCLLDACYAGKARRSMRGVRRVHASTKGAVLPGKDGKGNTLAKKSYNAFNALVPTEILTERKGGKNALGKNQNALNVFTHSGKSVLVRQGANALAKSSTTVRVNNDPSALTTGSTNVSVRKVPNTPANAVRHNSNILAKSVGV